MSFYDFAPKNVQLRRSVDMAKRPPNDSKFFLVVVLILKIANLDAAAGFEDFCPQKYALMYINYMMPVSHCL